MKGILIIMGLGFLLTLFPVILYLLVSSRSRLKPVALGLCLAAATLTLFLAGLETFWYLAGRHLPGQLAAKIPEELARREVPGTKDYYCHGHLHRQNGEGWRMSGWGDKSPQVFRIMALGDSLTYGQGVAEEEAYPQVLSRMLNQTVRVEVLNFGVCGYQISDIRRLLEKYLDRVQPDLVMYGMCLNDFLPSMMMVYPGSQWELPLPKRFKDWLAKETMLFALLTRKYDETLRRFHVRRDFIDDILFSLEHNTPLKREFLEDSSRMSKMVAARNLPPILASVIHQHPKDQRWLQMAEMAQQLLGQAGMSVLDGRSYFRGREDEVFNVSPWEGHPNAECHRIFARIFCDGMMKCHQDLLSGYARN
jgi:hypothetical protein